MNKLGNYHSHAGLPPLLLAVIISFFSAYTSSGLASDARQPLVTSTYIKVSEDKTYATLYLEVNTQPHLSDLFVRYSNDHWKTFQDTPLKQIVPGTWRGSIGALGDQQQIEFNVAATDGVHGGLRWNFSPQSNARMTIQLNQESLTPASPETLPLNDRHLFEFEDNLESVRLLDSGTRVKGGFYLSVTTTPHRIRNLSSQINALDLSSFHEVFVVVPQRFARDGSTYEIPRELLEIPKVRLIRPEIDLGPITKLLPVIEYLKQIDPAGTLVTIDDDMIYPSAVFAALKRLSATYPGAAIGASGQDISFWGIPRFGFPLQHLGNYVPEKVVPVDVLEGFAGVAYPVAKIDSDQLRRLSQVGTHARTSDDFVIGLGLALSNVPRLRVTLPEYSAQTVKPQDFGLQPDALHRIGVAGDAQGNSNGARYYQAYKEIMERAGIFDFETLTHKQPRPNTCAQLAWNLLR